jgi:hypothetical protein
MIGPDWPREFVNGHNLTSTHNSDRLLNSLTARLLRRILVQKHESESGMGVQGAQPPAGARGILSGGQVIGAPASFPFPKKVC